MTQRDDATSLADMLSHAREAHDLLGSCARGELARNRVLQLALTRLVEVIGEAANRVSLPARERIPDIPWPQVIGMRNRLAHGYDVIDYDRLWDTVANELPSLIAALEERHISE